MLKIRAIKLEVNTTSGLFGAEYEFTNGLNIIRGDNSTGKSSLFQSILYGLGFEELLGGKNEKTMQSALKDQVEFPDGKLHPINQSFVYLEIENKEIITIKRSITSETRKAQLVDVFSGALITSKNEMLPSRPMYIHDKGGASDNIYGFHVFLSEFLSWNLPEVITTKGETSHLYLQQIAPAFIVEQKTGWSDFFATLPYYAMRNTESLVVEFLLSMDVFENEKRKQQVTSAKQQLISKWQNLFISFNRLAEKSGGTLRGLDQNIGIINSFNNIYIAIIKDEKELTISDFNEQQKEELIQLEKQQTTTVGNNITKNEDALKKLNDKLNQLSLNYEMLSPELNYDSEKLKQYGRQLEAVKEDLRKNKGALKVKSLGFELPAETASDSCPTCHQPIKDSLLPSEIKQTPMRIEDNVSFLEAQQKMIEVYVEGQERIIKEKENKLATYLAQLSETRQEIRDTKKELVQDERLPSVLEIEKRLNLKKRVEFFSKLLEDFAQLLEELKGLSKELEGILSREKNLPRDFFSSQDRKKISSLQENFIEMLKKFNYQSKPFEAIKISNESYLPVAQKMIGEQLFYNIKFDSSASDFIRCLWSYYTAIFKTSVTYQTNHPMLLIFDEPKQQDMAIGNFKSFLTELSQFKDQQVLVFASFENSDASFLEATKGLNFTLNRIEDKLIKPIALTSKV
ncbi:MAG: AAA family ATPase [Chryseolinea sp.]